MTKSELEELLEDCPSLYHMAAGGSWPAIRERGLLSTSALLDLYGMEGKARGEIEAKRRPTSVKLAAEELPQAVVRDQVPMDDKGLLRCLKDGLSPEEWYRILNSKVFFWLTQDRLLRLLNAGLYRNEDHDVLELDSRALMNAYASKIWLCPMNSGCTKPMPHPRGKDTFQRISTYPYTKWRAVRRRGERVVELAVDYAVPDVARLVKRVSRMRGNDTLKELFGR